MPGGAQTRGSEYCGRIPREGPPVPTIGPTPSSSVVFAAAEGAGIVVGTAVGATTLISRDFSGRPSPPLRPVVGVVTPGRGSVMNPTRSSPVWIRQQPTTDSLLGSDGLQTALERRAILLADAGLRFLRALELGP